MKKSLRILFQTLCVISIIVAVLTCVISGLYGILKFILFVLLSKFFLITMLVLIISIIGIYYTGEEPFIDNDNN